jgi:hypothetical protein
MHTGGTWGSTCLLWAHPETGQGAVIMTNPAAAQGIIRFEIPLSIATEYGWPLVESGHSSALTGSEYWQEWLCSQIIGLDCGPGVLI